MNCNKKQSCDQNNRNIIEIKIYSDKYANTDKSLYLYQTLCLAFVLVCKWKKCNKLIKIRLRWPYVTISWLHLSYCNFCYHAASAIWMKNGFHFKFLQSWWKGINKTRSSPDDCSGIFVSTTRDLLPSVVFGSLNFITIVVIEFKRKASFPYFICKLVLPMERFSFCRYSYAVLNINLTFHFQSILKKIHLLVLTPLLKIHLSMKSGKMDI